ncbi:NUDIX hydrolase [Leucobacter aridicollis]|uniref:8-oxo-dGTP pyrophosphatase MutT (NUDIX family) n=1 Tax=Leucobacter aridicollis TaxID=283878 RepID=A0A852QYV6_9MICO|nr:CoA pyrophosphatase [Leucobacter aridicollis]MBL3683139.1 CoA pyrophosphatase [Leucobacter aridicollis]NYD25367.1 8-oxo-dGTP pyrophosphatase MutT (NUDIX family) [Leucobacter aridicollis]
MARTKAEARQQLKDAVDRGFGIDFEPPFPQTTGELRRSAVLILFGALDRVPADPASGEPVPAELDVLLTRRATRMRHHAGQIAFPGGGVEPEDADITQTALREAAEETGLDPAGVEVLGTLPEIHVPVSRNLVTPVIGWWRLPSNVAADHTESVEVFRVPVAEMLDPAARGHSVLRRAGATHRGAAFKLQDRFGGHTVWGFTGMLLSSVFDGVGWTVPWQPGSDFEVTG